MVRDANGEWRWGWGFLFDGGFGSTIRSEGSKKTEVFFVVGLMEVAVWALVKTAVFLPVSQLVTVGAECSSAMFLGYCLKVPEEG